MRLQRVPLRRAEPLLPRAASRQSHRLCVPRHLTECPPRTPLARFSAVTCQRGIGLVSVQQLAPLGRCHTNRVARFGYFLPLLPRRPTHGRSGAGREGEAHTACAVSGCTCNLAPNHISKLLTARSDSRTPGAGRGSALGARRGRTRTPWRERERETAHRSLQCCLRLITWQWAACAVA
jgi:hypothetical protein